MKVFSIQHDLRSRFHDLRAQGGIGEADRDLAEQVLAVALEAPRWRLDPNGQLRIESRIPSQIRKKLVSWGHDVVRIGPWEGSGLAQLLLTLSEDEVGSGGADERKTCLHVGATDPRGEGVALGV